MGWVHAAREASPCPCPCWGWVAKGHPMAPPGCWRRASVSPTGVLQVTKGCIQPQNHHGAGERCPVPLVGPLSAPSPSTPGSCPSPPAPHCHAGTHHCCTSFSVTARGSGKKRGEKKKKKEFSVFPVLALLCTSHKPLPGLEGGGGAHGHHVPEPRLCIPVSHSLRGPAQGSPGGHAEPPPAPKAGSPQGRFAPCKGSTVRCCEPCGAGLVLASRIRPCPPTSPQPKHPRNIRRNVCFGVPASPRPGSPAPRPPPAAAPQPWRKSSLQLRSPLH